MQVYDYWMAKRKRRGKPLLRSLQAPTPSADQNPANCFRCMLGMYRGTARSLLRTEWPQLCWRPCCRRIDCPLHMLTLQWPDSTWLVSVLHKPEEATTGVTSMGACRPRERIHRPQTRRRKENNEEAMEKMRLIQTNLSKARELVEQLLRRERKKRDIVVRAVPSGPTIHGGAYFACSSDR